MPLVLVPGFMLDREMWSDLAPRLLPFGPLVHADPAAGASIEELARRTLEAAPERFDLVGFSMGGYVAREMVRQAPERVGRLVLIATSARGDGALQARRQSEAESGARTTYAGLSRRAIARSLAPAREQDAALVERIHAAGLRLGAETFRRQSAFHRTGDADRLGAIRCPTLVVAGRHDRLRSLEESEELHAGIPGSEFVVLDAGHMVPMEAPDALAPLLEAFLRR
ncbi:MAG: alpha/beta hydrolase [Xylophilus ampelinus]